LSGEHAKIAILHTGGHVETGTQGTFACDLLNPLTNSVLRALINCSWKAVDVNR